MSMRVGAFVVGALCVLTSGCASITSLQSAAQRTSIAGERVAGKRLVADYGFWSKTQSPSYSADQIPFHRLTHIIHANIAAAPSSDGSLEVPSGFLEPELVRRAHASGVKVMVLVGAGAEVFSDLAGAAAARDNFARSLRAFVDVHGYDGVDIDWEYPHGSKDGSNFVAMMAALRASMPAPKYLLSIDVPSDPRQVLGSYDFDGLLPLLDFVNDMTYDMAGPWTATAQINSAIYPDPSNPQPQGSVEQSLDLFIQTYKIPPSMINVGNPFYGYHYTSTEDLYDRCKCHGQAAYVNYGTYVKQRVNAMGWRRRLDVPSGNPYLLFGTPRQPGFITYDDPVSTYRRVAYSLWQRNAGGVFMWSLDEDYDGHSQDLFDAMFAAYSHPSFDYAP
jgi:chitinase